MTDPQVERAAIRDAMQRLIDGNPVRSDGKLTIKSLAEEAGVKRWLLTHRHTDLQVEFRARFEGDVAEPAIVVGLRHRIEELAKENEDLRSRLREANKDRALLERHLAVEALENDPERKPRLRVVDEPEPG